MRSAGLKSKVQSPKAKEVRGRGQRPDFGALPSVAERGSTGRAVLGGGSGRGPLPPVAEAGSPFGLVAGPGGGGSSGSGTRWSSMKVLEVGFGDVAAENFGEILLEIAFGVSLRDPDRFWGNAVIPQLLGKPEVGDRFSPGHLGPGTVKTEVERLDKVTGEKAATSGLNEQNVDVEEKAGNRAGFGAMGTEGEGGLASEAGPATASDVSQDEQGFPEIGGAIIQCLRELRGGAGDLVLGDRGRSGRTCGAGRAQAGRAFEGARISRGGFCAACG